jgi:hypothetical protein
VIRLLKLPEYKVAHVVGSGPSWSGVKDYEREPGSLLIGVNDAAYNFSGERGPFIHLTADYPYARDKPVALGAVGVWVRHGEHPFPRCPEFPMWVPGVGGEDHNARIWSRGHHLELDRAWAESIPGYTAGVTVAGSGGVAGYSLACMAEPEEIHLWGFDGGPGYEAHADALAWAIGESGVETFIH